MSSKKLKITPVKQCWPQTNQMCLYVVSNQTSSNHKKSIQMYREPLDSYSQWNQTICLFKLRQKETHKLQHNTQKHEAGYADSRRR